MGSERCISDRLGEGRDLATRKRAGEHIFKALSAHLDPVFANSKFALSFDMQINTKKTSWKHNNNHDQYLITI
mgnify:CR=1 FL=1